MRLKNGAVRLTLVRGGDESKKDRGALPRPLPVQRAPMLRLVGATSRELSPGAQALLGWLDDGARRAMLAELPDTGLDLLRIDAAARLAHEARTGTARRARGGEAS